ncbi:MAG: flavoprotein [Mycobacteriaceae bacterium]|nr:flavoprotein [Mycobacteriaceae bacterium]
MDSRTTSLVRTTFKAVAAQEGGPEKLTSSFYAILFSNHPATRDFFPAAMNQQRERLVAALAHVVDGLEDLESLLPYLEQLGRDHRKFGVEPRHYAAVGESLLTALRTYTSGTEIWTDEVNQAWTDVIGLIAGTMIDAANSDRTPPVWGGVVVQHQQPLRDLAIVRLQLSEPMGYSAGQYVSVQIPARPRMWRYLTPAVPANEHGEIEFHVRAVTGGWVSPSIVGHTKIGDQWLLGAPIGGLGLPEESGQDMLMIGCGTGITPFRAQVLAMAHRHSNPRVHLYVCGRHPCDLYDLDMLWQLSLTNPWLTVTPVTEEVDNPWWFDGADIPPPGGIHRRITGPISRVVTESGAWTDRNVQIAGPPGMILTTKFRLMAAGVPKENIRHDPIY